MTGMGMGAGTFFAEAITPIEETHRTAREANVRLNQMIEIKVMAMGDILWQKIFSKLL